MFKFEILGDPIHSVRSSPKPNFIDDHSVVSSEDGTLFIGEDINFFNRQEIPSDAVFTRRINEIVGLQRVAESYGKKFIPIYIPSKTSLFSGKLPGIRYQGTANDRPSRLFYERFKKTAQEQGLVYIDALELLQKEQTNSGLPAFPKTGRHFTKFSACLVIEEAIGRLQKNGIPGLKSANCKPAFAAPASSDDQDLLVEYYSWRKKRIEGAVPNHSKYRDRAIAAAAPRVSALFVGTSFNWALAHEASESSAFNSPVDLFYYDHSPFQIWASGAVSPLTLDHGRLLDWGRFAWSHDVIFVDWFESQIDNSLHVDFIGQLRTFLVKTEKMSLP